MVTAIAVAVAITAECVTRAVGLAPEVDRHCTPAGYRVLAEAIFEEPESRSLVP